MKTKLSIEDLNTVLEKMKLLNLSEAYVSITKKGIDVYLYPCEKAKCHLLRSEIEMMIANLQELSCNTAEIEWKLAEV